MSARALPWLTRRPVPLESARESLRGWRAWQVVEDGSGPVLASWWLSALWPARRALEARCGLHGSRPALHHMCGIHAFDKREDALAYAEANRDGPLLFARSPARALGIAIGRVSGWGRVVGHTRGWRSQFAYPFDVYLVSGDRRLVRSLADRYAVETAPLLAV